MLFISPLLGFPGGSEVKNLPANAGNLLHRIHTKGHLIKVAMLSGFPGSLVVKYPPANAGDTGSIADPGRFQMLWSNYITTIEPMFQSLGAETTAPTCHNY